MINSNHNRLACELKLKRQTRLQIVEVAHGADPVHQQGNLGAAVFVRRAGLWRTGPKASIGPKRRQPSLGPQASLQEANFIPQLILVQNPLHLNRSFDYFSIFFKKQTLACSTGRLETRSGTHVKRKDDLPKEAQCLLSVSVHDVSGINAGAWNGDTLLQVRVK